MTQIANRLAKLEGKTKEGDDTRFEWGRTFLIVRDADDDSGTERLERQVYRVNNGYDKGEPSLGPGEYIFSETLDMMTGGEFSALLKVVDGQTRTIAK
jgi:hypothetical protein